MITGGFPDLDDQIELMVLGTTYTFKFINDASTPGINEIHRNNAGATADYNLWLRTVVIPEMKKNYFINRNYFISCPSFADTTSGRLFFYAKEKGSIYNVTRTYTTPFTKFAEYSYVVGSDKVLRPNFKIYCDVYIETAAFSNSYSFCDSLEADVDTNGNAAFYLERSLHKFLSNKALTSDYADIETQMQRRFFTIYGEKYGSPIVYYPSSVEPTIKPIVQLGGISEGQFAIDQLDQFNLNFNIPYANLLTYFIVNSLPYDAPLWISYLCQPDLGFSSLNLKIRKYTPNDGWQTNIYDPFDATVNNILTFNCSSSNLEFLTNVPGNEIQKIEIIISHEGIDDVAGPYTIYYDYNQYASANVFVFRNSLGRYDSIYCTGNTSIKPEISFDKNIFTRASFDKLQQKKTSAKTTNRIFETTTGPFADNWNIDTATHRELLLDFFSSDQVFIWKDEKLQPVNILTDKPSFGLDSDSISNIPFAYEFAYSQTSFSPGI